MSNKLANLPKERKPKQSTFFGKNFLTLGWGLLVIVFLVGLAMLRLAWWQWHRFIEKSELKAHYSIEQTKAPQEIEAVSPLDESVTGLAVSLNGTFLSDKYFLHQNQVVNGQSGFDVLMPFQLTKTGDVVLVNRGWVSDADAKLPVFSDSVTLLGRLRKPQSRTFGLHEEEKLGWPRKIVFIKLDKLSKQLEKPLLPVMVMLSDDSLYAFKTHWSPALIVPERNLGYFLQWIAFTLVLWTGFVILNRRYYSKEGE